MGLDSGKFTAELVKLRDNTKAVKPRYEEQLDRALIDAAAAGEAYMKANAPWRDDTGNRKDRVPGAARAGLFAVANVDGSHKVITFSHGVDYGIWLEIKHSGRHEIIMPSIKHIGQELMESTEESLTIGFRRLPGSPGAVVKAQKAIGRAEAASGRAEKAASRARELEHKAAAQDVAGAHKAAFKAGVRAQKAAESAAAAQGRAERAAARTRKPSRRRKKR